MHISDIIQLKFPEADLVNKVILQDDGNGAYIAKWDDSLGNKPSHEDLNRWDIELTEIKEEKDSILILKEKNKEIYKKLEEIDLKSIRALRTGDTNRLESLEQEAIVLRAQLVK